MKRVYRYLIVVLLVIACIIESVRVVRLFDLKQIINITHDAWLGFFGTLVEILLTMIGFLWTIYIFVREKEEKEKPIVIIKPAIEKDCSYRCENIEENYTQKKEIYFELINKSDIMIKNPRIKCRDGKILNIYKKYEMDELDYIEPQSFNRGNKYIISIDINYFEGMKEFVTEDFELLYQNINNKKFISKFCVEIRRHKPEYTRIYFKE